MNKRQAGQKGGEATLAKYGRDHFSEIGKKGAAVFYEKYTVVPFGVYQWAIVDRSTQEIVAYNPSHPKGL